jgi:hypothetical protein
MRFINSTQGQWLGDVAIKHAGGIESVFELAVINDVSLTENLNPGTILTPTVVTNKRVMNYYERNGLIPASSDTGSAQVVGRGIGHMTVNIDFIIQ